MDDDEYSTWVGRRCRALFRLDDSFYPATVVKYEGKGRFLVRFKKGTVQARTGKHDIQLIQEGDDAAWGDDIERDLQEVMEPGAESSARTQAEAEGDQAMDELSEVMSEEMVSVHGGLFESLSEVSSRTSGARRSQASSRHRSSKAASTRRSSAKAAASASVAAQRGSTRRPPSVRRSGSKETLRSSDAGSGSTSSRRSRRSRRSRCSRRSQGKGKDEDEDKQQPDEPQQQQRDEEDGEDEEEGEGKESLRVKSLRSVRDAQADEEMKRNAESASETFRLWVGRPCRALYERDDTFHPALVTKYEGSKLFTVRFSQGTVQFNTSLNDIQLTDGQDQSQAVRYRRAPASASLWDAARRGDLLGIEYYIQRGANVDAPEETRAAKTPLILACENGHLQAAKRLLMEGAEDTDGRAFMGANQEVRAMLVDFGFGKTKQNGKTKLVEREDELSSPRTPSARLGVALARLRRRLQSFSEHNEMPPSYLDRVSAKKLNL